MFQRDPENIIRENQNIPLFIFEYFAQKSILGFIDKSLEKTCLFHYNEADGYGIVSALITMTKLRRHLDFLDEEQANELVKRRKEANMLYQRALTF